jgi:putative colanic acid biosynthesis acetyltransferase WcaB
MYRLIQDIFQDWHVNQTTSLKCRLILVMFRITQTASKLPFPFSLISFPCRFLYQVIIEYLLGVEIPFDTQIGSNLQLHHAHSLVINSQTTIGNNCILRHCTTIGNKKTADGSSSGSPQIGNYVEIGCNVVILGGITIGDYAVIGAGSVVIKDVVSGTVVAGNPAKVIKKEQVFSAK